MGPAQHRYGFTLVELAIVLVIVGLLIGGILIGQDLVRAATINATIRDIERFNAAATTFRTKYVGLPGDLTARRALQLNFNTTETDASRNGMPGLGDGNGLIEGGALGSTDLNAETALFWTDLGLAGLLAESSSGYTSTTALSSITSTAAVETGVYLPKAKINYSATVHVTALSGRNHFVMGAMTVAAGVVTGIANSSGAAISSLEASFIDIKTDDGSPLNGTIVALAGGPLSPALVMITPAAPAENVCVSNASTSPSYATDLAILDSPSCYLGIRASF